MIDNFHDRIIYKFKDKKIIAISLIMFAVLVGIFFGLKVILDSTETINKYFFESPKNNFIEISLKLSQEILFFLKERGNNEPEIDFNNWDNSIKALRDYSRETMNIYSIKFASKVISTKDQFEEEGIVDIELNRFYEHPTNSIGIRIVGERIGSMANKLKSQEK